MWCASIPSARSRGARLQDEWLQCERSCRTEPDTQDLRAWLHSGEKTALFRVNPSREALFIFVIRATRRSSVELFSCFAPHGIRIAFHGSYGLRWRRQRVAQETVAALGRRPRSVRRVRLQAACAGAGCSRGRRARVAGRCSRARCLLPESAPPQRAFPRLAAGLQIHIRRSRVLAPSPAQRGRVGCGEAPLAPAPRGPPATPRPTHVATRISNRPPASLLPPPVRRSLNQSAPRLPVHGPATCAGGM